MPKTSGIPAKSTIPQRDTYQRPVTYLVQPFLAPKPAHRLRISGNDLAWHPVAARLKNIDGIQSGERHEGGQGRVQSLATWWTDTAVHRMRRKYSAFEKQSANQFLLSVSAHQYSIERGEIYPDVYVQAGCVCCPCKNPKKLGIDRSNILTVDVICRCDDYENESLCIVGFLYRISFCKYYNRATY